MYRDQGGKFPDPILALTLDYKDPLKPELDEIAKEINGKDLSTGKQMTSFALLKDDGTTTAGDWIYTGGYPDSGNLMKRRAGIQDPKTNDPTGMGFYPNWAWSWPLNRRVLYNRASADLAGKPWDPARPGITWDGAKWVGDVPDYPATMNPKDPKAWLPFIMNGEGVGRLFSNSMVDGPFPEHYEPVESPVQNPLHSAVSASPVAFLYDQAAGRSNRFGTPQEFPYIATSYRLTEHEHYVTQHVPHLVQLQPEPFVEIPSELAKTKGIKTGDKVRVSSKRGKIEVLAMVTKRLGPLTVAGQTVYQIGIPIHWGYTGIPADRDPAEFQTPICEVGFGTKIGLDPAGAPTTETEPLYVIVPFFDADHDGEAAGGLASTLKCIFGFVPDAFDPTPGVPVQCPEPGGNLTVQKGAFGTCTMHPTQIDYAQLLSEVRPDLFAGLKNLNLPLVNHSHIIDGTNFNPIWWQLKIVLVTDPSVWPDVNATTGLRSVADITNAQAAGKALATINSNFFLFFGSREMKMPM